jgi:FMN phosphatase YigB (HAD superfamily)
MAFLKRVYSCDAARIPRARLRFSRTIAGTVAVPQFSPDPTLKVRFYGIKLAVLDVDDTLAHPTEPYEKDYENLYRRKLAALLGCSEGAAARIAAHYGENRAEDAFEDEKLPSVIREIFPRLTIPRGIDFPLTRTELYECFVDVHPARYYRADAELVRHVATWRKRGIRLVVVTNTVRYNSEEMLRALGFDPAEDFDAYYPWEPHHRKLLKTEDPHGLMRRLLREHGVEPRDAISIGDGHNDVVPAHEIGMHAGYVGRDPKLVGMSAERFHTAARVTDFDLFPDAVHDGYERRPPPT